MTIPENDVENFEKIVLTRLMYLNSTIVGVITGIVFGVGIFLATNFLLIKGGRVVGPHLGLLSQYFIGYSVTFIGSLVGLVYGFITGFIVGTVVSRLYNWIARLREPRHGSH